MKITAKIEKGQFAFSRTDASTIAKMKKDGSFEGARVELEIIKRESRKMRKWFEGAVVAMVCFYQEGMDHRKSEDIKKMREWLKAEFNGEGVVVDGKTHIIGQSTKGILAEYSSRVLDWMGENGYQIELLKEANYKKWRDEIFPYGGPDNYLSYLEECGKLKKCI